MPIDLITPKVISIDTSIFGDFARDYYSANEIRRSNARQLIQYMSSKGLVPFISFHHIEEILQHRSDTVVFDRWSLLKRFPAIAWLNAYSDSNALGSILDIQTAEVKYLVDNGDSIDNLIKYVKHKLVNYSSGEWFVNQFEDAYCTLRESGQVDIQSKKIIESLSFVQNKNVSKTKLSTLNSSRLKKPEEVSEYFRSHRSHLTQELIEKGDKKLKKPSIVASEFIEDVIAYSNPLYTNSQPLYEKFIEHTGVSLDQINPKTTVSDLGYLAIFNSKMKMTLNELGWVKRKLPNTLESDLPSWIIWRELDKLMKNENRAQGSNLIDKYVAAFSLYCDALVIDKRVHDYFRQLKPKLPTVSPFFSKIIKVSNYTEISQVL